VAAYNGGVTALSKYEYKTIVVDAKDIWGSEAGVDKFDEMLNYMGHEGWRLVQQTASNKLLDDRYFACVFERELKLY